LAAGVDADVSRSQLLSILVCNTTTTAATVTSSSSQPEHCPVSGLLTSMRSSGRCPARCCCQCPCLVCRPAPACICSSTVCAPSVVQLGATQWARRSQDPDNGAASCESACSPPRVCCCCSRCSAQTQRGSYCSTCKEAGLLNSARPWHHPCAAWELLCIANRASHHANAATRLPAGRFSRATQQVLLLATSTLSIQPSHHTPRP
jgi:hypothetical protein